jgi:hypothetical protein
LKLAKGLLKSPLLAPIVEAFFTYKDVQDMIGNFSSGEIDEKELNQKVGTRLIEAITGLIGGAGGAILGGSLGSVIPVAGNIIGAIAGGVLGDVGGRAIGKLIANAIGPKTSEFGEYALSSPIFKVPEQTPVEIEDGIITKEGKVIKPSTDDTIYAMKDGGPLADALNKTPTLLGNLINIESSNMELMYKNNLLLTQILEKINSGNPIITSNNTSIVNTQKSSSFRDMQFAV